MTLTRRTFMVGTTYVSARAALSNSMPTALRAAEELQLGAAVGTLSDWNEDGCNTCHCLSGVSFEGGHEP